MHKKEKKLILSRETLVTLSDDKLLAVIGGKKETKKKECAPEPEPEPTTTSKIDDPSWATCSPASCFNCDPPPQTTGL
jgi:hypothetical protein